MRSGFNSKENYIAVKTLFVKRGEAIVAGTVITPEDHPRIRRKRWFRKRFIQKLNHARAIALIENLKKEENIIDDVPPISVTVDDDVSQKAIYEHEGGPWYMVTFADGTQERVKGKKKAKALVDG